MKLNAVKNINPTINYEELLTDSFQLKSLLQMVLDSLQSDSYIDFNELQRFSYQNKNQLNPFGHDWVKGGKVKSQSFYRRNRLKHKLFRIYKEFEFVRNNVDRYKRLTLREKEIIQLLLQGYNNPKIANKLFISRSTVEQHRKHINQKLEVKSFTDLINYGYAFDMI